MKESAEQSQQEALNEELFMYDGDEEIQIEDASGDMTTITDHPGIDIETDARHGWRKNAKDTSVVALGHKSHKVLRHEHVTKSDDRVTQRHELIGTKRIYDHIQSQGFSVNIHVHDRNMSVNKWVREGTCSTNQNDTWHAVKSYKKSLTTICAGPKSKHGKTWHKELNDKLEPLCTHAHWSIRNCNGDGEALRNNMLNAVEHYKGNHTHCFPESRCKLDPQYDPSTVIIESPWAEQLLREKITSSTIYKHAEDFKFARDTYYTESFNNALNIFQDKRIPHGDLQYSLRSYLAVLHWNENVGRDHTSVYNPVTPQAPRSRKGKKNLKKATYLYRDNLWDLYKSNL